MIKEGWLKEQFEKAEKDVEKWPDWMKKELIYEGKENAVCCKATAQQTEPESKIKRIGDVKEVCLSPEHNPPSHKHYFHSSGNLLQYKTGGPMNAEKLVPGGYRPIKGTYPEDAIYVQGFSIALSRGFCGNNPPDVIMVVANLSTDSGILASIQMYYRYLVGDGVKLFERMEKMSAEELYNIFKRYHLDSVGLGEHALRMED